MVNFFKKNLLLIAVFITGACVLIVEVVATRVLSPFFGNTIFTVTSVISVILAALSWGYYVGGHFADRHPRPVWFFRIIVLSGIVLLAFHVLGLILLPLLSYVLPISTGPLIASLLLFFFPAFLLGTLSPYAVRLQAEQMQEQGIGSVAGNIFFWSTSGSIIGSLLAGFVLIPHFGVDHILFANGLVLFFLGLIPLVLFGEKKRFGAYVLSTIMLTVFSYTVSYAFQKNFVYSKDGVYEKISIYDGTYAGRPTRFLGQDRTSSGAMFLDSNDPQDLVYDYTKYYLVHNIFNPDLKNALVIGGGAYSIPKALLAEKSDVIVDVVEIEPSLYDLSKKYFNVNDDPRLHHVTADGRRFLHDSEKKYDLIFSDVYYSLYSVPSHFTTQEFFALAKEKLNKNGVFIANMISDLSPEQPSFILSEIRTFQTVFPNSYFFAVESPTSTKAQNIMFVGYNNTEKHIDLHDQSIIASTSAVVRSLPEKLIDTSMLDLSVHPILTDNYAPVEYMAGQVLRRTLF